MLNWYNLRRSRLWRFATQYHYSQMLIVRTNGIGSGDITQLPTIYRASLRTGCFCQVAGSRASEISRRDLT